jgi:hypothetical protein
VGRWGGFEPLGLRGVIGVGMNCWCAGGVDENAGGDMTGHDRGADLPLGLSDTQKGDGVAP